MHIERITTFRTTVIHLRYLGISPKAPGRSGKVSPQRLRDRVRYHYQGNAEGSTLPCLWGACCVLISKYSCAELEADGE